MNLLPVVEREFRVASRRRETWWLRLAFAAAARLAVLTGAFSLHTLPAHGGQFTLTCLAVGGFHPSLLQPCVSIMA